MGVAAADIHDSDEPINIDVLCDTLSWALAVYGTYSTVSGVGMKQVVTVHDKWRGGGSFFGVGVATVAVSL